MRDQSNIRRIHLSEEGQASGLLTLVSTLLIALFGICISLVGVEIIVRFFLMGGNQQATWSDRPKAYYKAESSSNLQDYAYTQKEPGKYRIAVIGDSFTFAPYMQFDDAFPKRLERMLNLNTKGKEVEVINYGIPGASTSNEIGVAKEAMQAGADFILLQITLNDAQIKPYRPTGLTGINQFGAYEPKTSSSFLKHWKTLRFVQERLHNTQTYNNYIDYYFKLFQHKRGFGIFKDSIKRFGQFRVKKDVQVAAVLFPLFGIALNENYPFFPLHEKVQKLLQENNIPFLDLYKTYEGIPLERIQVIPGDDFHPNEIGHRMAAESIYEWLVKKELLADDLHIQEQFTTRIDIRPLDKWRIAPTLQGEADDR